jgi:3-isopropylmalate/(R)-2-methylmalate dehydratase large subunit
MGKTIAEKILAAKAGERAVRPGQIVNAKVDVAMSHENAALVKKHFEELGLPRVWDPERIVLLFDHRVPAESVKTAQGQREVRQFAKAQGIKHFYDMSAGICHQVLPEKGHVRPGELIVGTDSHTTTHGAFGAFATGIGATEMAAVWATGELWLRVPETFKITVTGRFQKWVGAKDPHLAYHRPARGRRGGLQGRRVLRPDDRGDDGRLEDGPGEPGDGDGGEGRAGPAG